MYNLCIGYNAQVQSSYCRYNFMLNEVPNNNDAMRIANIVLNEVPNSHDVTCVANNVCLTTMGTQQFSMVASYIAIMQNSQLTRDER